MAEKITIAQKFDATIAVLTGEVPAIAWDEDQAVEFLLDRKEKATRKSATKSPRKPKPEQEEFWGAVASFLAEQDEPVTATVVAEALTVEGAETAEEGKVSTQKASAALRHLVAEGCAVEVPGEKARSAKRYAIVESGSDEDYSF